MSLLLIFALACGLVAMIAALISPTYVRWFAAVGFLGVALLAINDLI